jgi:hypothetical protein
MTTSVASLITYAIARGVTVVNDTATTQALTRATDYITFGYVNRFSKGYGLTSPNVDEAIYEAAMIEVVTPNFFTKTFTPADQKMLTQVEGIKWTPIGDTVNGSLSATPASTKIEAMLRPYLATYIGIGSVG